MTLVAPGYWRATRAPRYSVLFALPLLVLYEVLALLLGPATGGVRNGADALLRGLALALGGRWAPVLLGGVILGVGAWLVIRDARAHRWHWRPRWFAAMLAESAVLAVVFGFVVATATAQLLGALALSVQGAGGATEPLAWLMLSLGAGLYEELVFRVLLVSGIAWLAALLFGVSRRASLAIAVAGSAVLFAAAHYVGSLGDPFAVSSFTFRLLAGLAFSALYALRGFGITAWTHALYDVYVGLL